MVVMRVLIVMEVMMMMMMVVVVVAQVCVKTTSSRMNTSLEKVTAKQLLNEVR